MIGTLLQLGAVVILGCALVATINRDRRRKRGEEAGDDWGFGDGGGDGDCGGGDGGGGDGGGGD